MDRSAIKSMSPFFKIIWNENFPAFSFFAALLASLSGVMQ